MNVSLILIILLVGAFTTYLAGDKLASKWPLFGLGAAATIVLLNNFNAGENISVLNQWINKPQVSIALTADGLSLAMLLLTTALTAIIIFTSFDEYKNAKAFYFNSFHVICNGGYLLSLRWFIVLYFLGTSINPIYFIALIWGNGDAESKKAVIKFFIYTLAGSLFMLIAFVYLYQKQVLS
jgi:NADH-quinone oxidoreductase subunit M